MWKHNTKQLGIAVDQLLNVMLCICMGEKAYADMTLSAHAHLWRLQGKYFWIEKAIDKLCFWDKEVRSVNLENLDIHDKRIVKHCELSYESEGHGNHLPEELR